MISVQEAKDLIQLHTQGLTPVEQPLSEAAGCTLAADIFAPFDVPLFAQAAMDGYAFNHAAWRGQPLQVANMIAAGDAGDIAIKEGGAVRIFTGAAMPVGADTVVMQEKTSFKGPALMIEDKDIKQGANVRVVGSEIKSGAKALEKGSLLVPGAVGFLAMLGLDKVQIIPKPKVAVLLTGKELQAPGTTPEQGKVYEANSYTINAALSLSGIWPVMVKKVPDDLEQTKEAIKQAIDVADLLLITGGVSVGDYDFVLPAAQACGVQTIFHKVAQKPGKPLFFGKASNTLVFGLPGNPASVLTCFYQYVVPALDRLMQKKTTQQMTMPLGEPVQKKSGLTYFLKGKIKDAVVLPLPGQESFRLSAFAVADCLIELPEKVAALEAGAPVKVYRF